MSLTNTAMRLLAIVAMPVDHPSRPAMHILLEDVEESSRAGVHAGGCFWTPEMLAEAEASVTRHLDGSIHIRFPIRHPWTERPDPDVGFKGVRAEPIYPEFKPAAEKQADPPVRDPGRPFWMPEHYAGPGGTSPLIDVPATEPPEGNTAPPDDPDADAIEPSVADYLDDIPF